MNAQITEWVDIGLRVVTASAATAVAIYVAQISRRQWKTNQEKLRLDLYQRRFEIYLRVLEYHWALLEWKGEPEQFALRGPFVKAFCESRFMFPKESGIYDFLSAFNYHAFRIVNFKSGVEVFGDAFSEERAKLSQQRIEDVNWVLGSIDTLIDKLAPYLNFHSL